LLCKSGHFTCLWSKDLIPKLQFPQGFLFGTASSAFQIEGSPQADGKGPSIWDRFSHKPGKIITGETAETACDTYRSPERDLDLMKELGLNAYRFSISWPRVLPTGRVEVNQKGLDYYRRLVDALLERNTQPFVTLFHWDTPQALQDLCGGFAGRDCAYYFADYAEIMTRALGDRVKHWMTINEPWEHAAFGHLLGIHAPGKRNPWTYFRVAHHQLLAHGLAMERIRTVSPDAQVGIVLSLTPIIPVTSSSKDIHGALIANQFMNDFFLDGIFKGRYPDPLWKQVRLARPHIEANDMQIISRPLDFLGVNYYSREVGRAAWYVPFLGAWVDDVKTDGTEKTIDGKLYTASGREVYPPAFYDLLMRLKNEYGSPTLYITENGAAFKDSPQNGQVHDPLRVDFLQGYMGEAARAIRDGVNIKGYFIWSFTDNFEWNLGYSARFGLVHVDFATQQRTIKNSGFWVQEMIREQAR
jgi:beta-glucosidase